MVHNNKNNNQQIMMAQYRLHLRLIRYLVLIRMQLLRQLREQTGSRNKMVRTLAHHHAKKRKNTTFLKKKKTQRKQKYRTRRDGRHFLLFRKAATVVTIQSKKTRKLQYKLFRAYYFLAIYFNYSNKNKSL